MKLRRIWTGSMNGATVIIADGDFPRHRVPLEYLASASAIVCCDGAAAGLAAAGYVPDAIVGDMDSLSNELRQRFSDRIFADSDQETNDLTKAVKWCVEHAFRDIVIVGATGKREDHTIANISLLAEYALTVEDIIMVTDTGIFMPAIRSREFKSFPGQQVSLFAIDPETEITATGLRYPLHSRKLPNWWCGSLNEAAGSSFSLEFSRGKVIVFRQFE